MIDGCLKRKQDNRGMSLVEIIIVVAIMSIFIGTVGYGLSMISGKPAEECGQKLLSALQHTRTITMGKKDTTITIFMDAEERIAVKEVAVKLLDNDGNTTTEERESVVGAKGVAVICTMSDGSTVNITGTNTVELKFDRGSGALRSTRVNGIDNSTVCTLITISKGDKIRYITITPVTGKLELTTTP